MAELTIENEDIEERLRACGRYASFSPQIQHVNDMVHEEATLIRKTLAQMPLISTPVLPFFSNDSSLIGRTTKGAVNEVNRAAGESLSHRELVDEVDIDPIAGLTNAEIGVQAVTEFPNLAWEAIKAGLNKEQITNTQLNIHIGEAQKHQKDIDLLLDFSAELTGHKEDAGELSQKAKDLLEELKGRGIDLFKGEDKMINKEKLAALKDLSNSQVDKLRSNLQMLFTTQIQPKIQAVGSIMEALKDILRNHRKACDKALQLPGRG